jgi:PAS domain S-box-containing protein
LKEQIKIILLALEKSNEGIAVADLDGNLEYVNDIFAKMQASEKRFRELFYHMNGGASIYEAKDNGNDFIFKDVNRVGERIGNIKKEDLLGKSVLKIFPALKEAGLFDVFKRVWKTDKPEYHPVLFYKAEEVGRWIENFVYKLPSGEIVAIYNDVTDRKQTQKALRESEKRYRDIFDNSPLGIFRSTLSGQFLLANRAFARCLGFDTPKELLQTVTNIADIYVNPHDREELKRFLQKQGVLVDYAIHLKDRMRGNCWISIYAQAVYNETGEVEYIDGFSIDITKRKWTELALIERSKELENKTYEIKEVNTALKVLLKYKDQDQKDFKEKIVANVKKLVLPYVEKLNNSRLNHQQRVHLNIIKSNLEDIISPYLKYLFSKCSDLTPKEIQIADLVKDGKTTKEIANLLNCSTGTIDFHRNNLRKKLGLKNTKTNLRSFLLSLT